MVHVITIQALGMGNAGGNARNECNNKGNKVCNVGNGVGYGRRLWAGGNRPRHRHKNQNTGVKGTAYRKAQ